MCWFCTALVPPSYRPSNADCGSKNQTRINRTSRTAQKAEQFHQSATELRFQRACTQHTCVFLSAGKSVSVPASGTETGFRAVREES
jgi:hypothetical protein